MHPALALYETRKLVDVAFRRAAVVVPFAPSRFYVNLTDTCNIRCRHCITGAPEKTENGRGRVMTPEVLHALAPALEHADYVGFTHAGEPLSAPLLEPLLERLFERRRGRPTVVHLLTNGLALTERRFRRLVELGVSSISFSVDGMTEATHDLVRIGSKIDRLLDRISAISALRAKEHPDVRLGVAWTLHPNNAVEVPKLLRFAAGAGLDWVKLEELVPCNPVAADLAGDLPPSVIDDARSLAERLGVRLLDHTREVEVFKCRLGEDAEMSRYALEDDYANRMEINPCRLPWEAVCVEPNGDVRPVDFRQPVEGNLLERDLADLFNGKAFQRARAQAIMRRPCGVGPATCPADPGPEHW